MSIIIKIIYSQYLGSCMEMLTMYYIQKVEAFCSNGQWTTIVVSTYILVIWIEHYTSVYNKPSFICSKLQPSRDQLKLSMLMMSAHGLYIYYMIISAVYGYFHPLDREKTYRCNIGLWPMYAWFILVDYNECTT